MSKPNSADAVEVRKEGLDKFYTVPAVSKRCIDAVFARYGDASHFDLIVEPSAGNGSFLHQLGGGANPSASERCGSVNPCCASTPTSEGATHKRVNIVGIDIAPEWGDGEKGDGCTDAPTLLTMDFFDYRPPADKKCVLVIGNPPFGKVSSLAIQFFNHAAKWAKVIAFIVPRTFRRPSVQNRLHRDFHLVHDEDVPTKPCCFTPPMMVKCCFQIWENRGGGAERDLVALPTTHPDWDFLAMGPVDARGQPTPPMGADFAIRAYGGKIGEIKKNGLDELRPKSWHWIKSNGRVDKDELAARFGQLDYSDSLNTVRQNSMGRGELVRLYKRGHFSNNSQSI